MESQVGSIAAILTTEAEIYEKVASIEEEKTSAILCRNGRELEDCVREQERLLSEIAALEEKRARTVALYAKSSTPEKVSLDELVGGMNKDDARKLMRCGHELKKVMLRVSSLSDTNRRLLEDNIEFFNIMLSGIKNQASIQGGYTRVGGTDQVMHKPLLFNKTV